MAENDISSIMRQLPADKRDLFLNQYNASKKEPAIAILLAIFLGGFGAHKFYMGKKNAGFWYLIFFWTYVPSILGIIEAVWISKDVNNYNAEKALEIARRLSATESKVELTQPVKDLIYKLVSNFETRQRYFDDPSTVLKDYELTDVERKAFSRIHRKSYDPLSADIFQIFGFGNASENATASNLLGVVSDSVNFLTQNADVELCSTCGGIGAVNIKTSKMLLGDFQETRMCSNCVGRGFSLSKKTT